MGKILLESHPHPKYPRLKLQQRSNSKFFQAVTFLDGKMRMASTKTTHLPTAFKIGEDWYRRELRASVAFGHQHPIAKLTSDPTFAEMFKSLLQDKPKAKHFYLLQKWGAIQDFWRSKLLSHATPALFKAFYTWRRKDDISNHTLHKDMVLIRQILKNAVLNGLLPQLPPIPPTGTITPNPRPWLTIQEYRRLTDAAYERIGTAPNKRTAEQRRDVHEIIGFLHDSMMRVGELYSLRYRDCRLELNKDGDDMLLCEVRGKRGVRTCVARADAAVIYKQRKARFNPSPDDLIFPEKHTDAFRELLIATNLRTDANGFERNLKSIRATAVSHMILWNPTLNLTLLARNMGTSVQMLDLFYLRRLSAEMHKDVLSEQPDEFKMRKLRKKLKKGETLERIY